MRETIPIVIPVQVPMTRHEAAQQTRIARHNLRQAWLTLLAIYERKGYRAMGYASWSEYATVELQLSSSHAYRLLTAAAISREFPHEGKPAGDVPETERQLRELTRLDTASMRQAIWEEAKADGNTSAEALRALINQHQGEDDEEKYRPAPRPRVRPQKLIRESQICTRHPTFALWAVSDEGGLEPTSNGPRRGASIVIAHPGDVIKVTKD